MKKRGGVEAGGGGAYGAGDADHDGEVAGGGGDLRRLHRRLLRREVNCLGSGGLRMIMSLLLLT